ncbi:hypothetical protein COBT_001347 [Conglomerata obtusa]
MFAFSVLYTVFVLVVASEKDNPKKNKKTVRFASNLVEKQNTTIPENLYSSILDFEMQLCVSELASLHYDTVLRSICKDFGLKKCTSDNLMILDYLERQYRKEINKTQLLYTQMLDDLISFRSSRMRR